MSVKVTLANFGDNIDSTLSLLCCITPLDFEDNFWFVLIGKGFINDASSTEDIPCVRSRERDRGTGWNCWLLLVLERDFLGAGTGYERWKKFVLLQLELEN